MAKKQALGRGLSALLPDAAKLSQIEEGERVQLLDISRVRPNPNQPRKNFDQTKLQELAESIRAHGVMQPLIVAKEGGSWLIVAGERRYRAAGLAGLTVIPCIERTFTPPELAEISLLENIQREDLNALEEAQAFYALINEYNYTQEELAASLGKSRSAIANTLRLLALAPQEKQALSEGKISAGHARALLSVGDSLLRGRLFARILKENLSVRQAEEAAQNINQTRTNRKTALVRRESAILKDLERQINAELGLKSRFQGSGQRGKLVIEYYSEDDLNTLLDKIIGTA